MPKDNREAHARWMTRSVLVPAGVAVAVIGAYLAWLGFQPAGVVEPGTQAVQSSREPGQIWGYALTFIALVAAASWFAPRASTVANSASGALLLIYCADVPGGSESEGWLFGIMLWGLPILAVVHLLAYVVFRLSCRAHGEPTYPGPGSLERWDSDGPTNRYRTT